MISGGITEDAFITLVEARLSTNYTDEQRNLIKMFGDGPVFCFASPGTGKTYTAIAGLLNAELFKQIPGKNIYALSFTRLATGELSVRHERACQALRISNTINFSTLHSLCLRILRENYQLLGMSSFSSGESLSIDRARNIVEGSLEEWGLALPPQKIAKVIRACNSFNASMTFDQDVVVTKMAFKECNVDFELFDKIRGLLFSYALLTEKISVSDILLYTVMLLTRHPEISQKFKQECRLMLVDEAQDLSLLQLRIISLLTDNPVLIGDMKQQIYAFNGACQEVVGEFYRLYPSTRETKLTQSFRCRNDIADFATRIIIPNKIGGEDYKGTGEGGLVHIDNHIDNQMIATQLKEDFVKNRNVFTRSYLFLTRNNISQIPIIEELYQQKLPFRANKYIPAYQVPLIKEMCELLYFASNPKDLKNIQALQYLIPDFAGVPLESNPLYKICKQTGASPFEVNYRFADMVAGNHAMDTLLDISEMLASDVPTGALFNRLWPIFNETYVKRVTWKLENKPAYYVQAVNTVTRKPFKTFLSDEAEKINIMRESERYRRGVRCYTMHASKGLEADVVYIIDADDGIIPNTAQLSRMEKSNCQVDIARAIREERSLCYVACTRAKEELHIIHNGEAPAGIMLGHNEYEFYDKLYDLQKSTGDDISAFESFTRRYIDE